MRCSEWLRSLEPVPARLAAGTSCTANSGIFQFGFGRQAKQRRAKLVRDRRHMPLKTDAGSVCAIRRRVRFGKTSLDEGQPGCDGSKTTSQLCQLEVKTQSNLDVLVFSSVGFRKKTAKSECCISGVTKIGIPVLNSAVDPICATPMPTVDPTCTLEPATTALSGRCRDDRINEARFATSLKSVDHILPTVQEHSNRPV